MKHYAAFLRGINVGGHRIKMSRLRELFEALGLEQVETVIASGNVLFATSSKDTFEISRRIEDQLERELGYASRTYLRTPAELSEVAGAEPFPRQDLDAEDATLYIVFLRYDPNKVTCERIEALGSADDRLRVVGREVYWLRRGRISDSPLTVPMIEKAAVGAPATRRKTTTIAKLATKLEARAAAEAAEERAEGSLSRDS